MEVSSFGYELAALMTATELVKDLRYKLQCFGVPLDG